MKQQIAVIDVGSNSVRLLWGKVGRLNKKYVCSTQVSEGLDRAGVLGKEPMARTASVIREYAELARSQGAQVIYAFATEAVRAAKNGAEFVALVKKHAGITLDVIDGETEATCGYLGAAGTVGAVTVLDIGGASVEIICGVDGVVCYKKSLPLGVVRLKERYDGDFGALEQEITGLVDGYGDVPKTDKLVAIGGTPLTLCAMMDGQTVYDAERNDGMILRADDLCGFYDRIKRKTATELVAEYPTLSDRRAQTIAYGLCELIAVMKKLGVAECVASEADNMEGYLRLRGAEV